MSSRRKSSTPCMVRVVSDLPDEQDDPEEVMDMEILASKDSGCEDHPPVIEDVEARGGKDKEAPESDPVSQKKQGRGYECKYCPFSTQNLNDFKEHVDSSHPNVILNPLYLCAVCNFNTKKFDSLTEHNESQHPGETNFKFKRIKMNNQTILEQTIEGKDNSAECDVTNEKGESHSSSVFPPCISTTVKSPGSVHTLFGGSELKSQLDGLIQKDQITAVNINGTVIIPEPTIVQGLSHVTPMLQRPPNFNSVPKIAVPLNTTKYNPSLDNNLTLIASFNKFPYPTHAELSWLTAASKHPEEQIKVWFTTQRLKQGITWSPEEVEEARKKMFNGSIPPAHHTFTVLPTSPVSQPSAKASQQPIVHTTVEHLGHVRTTAPNGLTVVTTTNSPAGSSHSLKRPLATQLSHNLPASDLNLPNSPPLITSQVRRPTIIQSIRAPAKAPSQISAFSLDGKKLKEQQGVELKASYPRGDKVVSPLPEANGTSRMDSKWPYDQTAPGHNNGIIHLDSGDIPAVPKPDFQHKSSVLTQFPLLERMKGKTAKQLKILEENFLRNSFPTHSDVDNLSAITRLSHQEIDSWFAERRALRDNLEQALLNSMGTKRMGGNGIGAITEKQLHQHQALQLNGIHKPSTGVGLLKSPPPTSHPLSMIVPGTIAPSVPNPNSCSVPPDGRSLALLKDDFAQTRWPSPEEFSQLEGRTGLARGELARWFTDSRLQSGSMDLAELFHNNGVNGGQGPPMRIRFLTSHTSIFEPKLIWSTSLFLFRPRRHKDASLTEPAAQKRARPDSAGSAGGVSGRVGTSPARKTKAVWGERRYVTRPSSLAALRRGRVHNVSST
ncbi:gap junction alpha-3 protein [Sarotherodon galilaeus]